MRSASLAELLIRMVAGREEATVLVGDMVEIAEARGSLWFWLSVTGLLFSRTWRHVLGFIAALYAFEWASVALLLPLNLLHHWTSPEQWRLGLFLDVLGVIGAALIASALNSVIHYGLQDFYARFALTVACLFALAIWIWWIPGGLYACGAILVAGVVFALRRAQCRWALCTVGLSVATALAFFNVGISALGNYEDRYVRAYESTHFNQGVYVGPQRIPPPPGDMLLNAMLPILSVLLLICICNSMHRRARRRFHHGHAVNIG